MDRLIELELVRCLGEVEVIGDLSIDTVRLQRLSYKRSLLVFNHLVKWYHMRSSTDIQRQVNTKLICSAYISDLLFILPLEF